MSKNGSQHRGFALDELMVCLAFVGVAASIAVPGLSGMVNNNLRIAAVNDFVSTMHIAQSEAIARNVRVTVCPSASGSGCDAVDWNEGWIIFTDNDSDQAVDADELLLGNVGAMSRIDIDSAQFDKFLIYRPNGRVMAANVGVNTGEAVFCDPRGADHARVVIISSRGTPRLSKTTMSGDAPGCP